MDPRFSTRSIVWSECTFSNLSSTKKCALDSRTDSSPWAVDTKLSPGTVLHNTCSGREACATLRTTPEASLPRPVSNTTINAPTWYDPEPTVRAMLVREPEIRSGSYQTT